MQRIPGPTKTGCAYCRDVEPYCAVCRRAVDPREVPGALASLEFVRWDRFCLSWRDLAVFGWIERSDSRYDFVVLIFDATGISYVTSSAEHSRRIGNILAGEPEETERHEHGDCMRVEHWFPKVSNAVRLTPKRGDR